MNNDVLLCTAVGPGKEYVSKFLGDTIKKLQVRDIYYIPITKVDNSPKLNLGDEFKIKVENNPAQNSLSVGQDSYYAKIAATRNQCRSYFLSGKWTHLFFLDCDIIPENPGEVINQLLDLKTDIASGIYPLRDYDTFDKTLPLLVYQKGVDSDVLDVMSGGYVETNVAAVGLGISLISRETLEKTSFRDAEGLQVISEDLAFCLDAKEKSKAKTKLDLHLTPWHVDEKLRAGRTIIASSKDGVVWQDYPAFIQNNFGLWQRGIPKFNLTEDQLNALGNTPGFNVGKYREVTTEVKPLQEILKNG